MSKEVRVAVAQTSAAEQEAGKFSFWKTGLRTHSETHAGSDSPVCYIARDQDGLDTVANSRFLSLSLSLLLCCF